MTLLNTESGRKYVTFTLAIFALIQYVSTVSSTNSTGSGKVSPILPQWVAKRPNSSQPLSGYEKLDVEFNVGVYYGSLEAGYYNHAAMWHYHDSIFTLSWKNAPRTEDTPGQRVLYSQSIDGYHWTNASVLFPNMSTSKVGVAQFAGPYAVLNGRLYATSTPAIISEGDAQGGTYCFLHFHKRFSK